MLDHHHAERLGTKYNDQSTTEIETSSHGSEVCNCRVQRVFFSLLAGLAKKKTSGTQGTNCKGPHTINTANVGSETRDVATRVSERE